jgi:uncharacterized protein (DUF427 family)
VTECAPSRLPDSPHEAISGSVVFVTFSPVPHGAGELCSTWILPVNSMARAIWNGKVIAESDVIETVEGNVYFPETSLKREYFRPSSTTSTCPWKGQARYMSLLIDGQDNPDAAWYYPDPKPAARKIKGFVAFWRGVEIEK